MISMRTLHEFLCTKTLVIALSSMHFPRARNPLSRASYMPASKVAAPKAPFTNEEIYGRIQKAVLEHRLAPGTKLIEERLAEVSGVSRTKIREVLNKLAHEGLVELVPNRGAFIRL